MSSLIEILSWDSRMFGRRIARIKSPHLTPALVQSIVKVSEKQHIDCLYFLAPSDDPISVACAETHQFCLVDVRMTLAIDAAAVNPPSFEPPSKALYRAARAADVHSLQSMARDMFSDSRFAVDTRFPAGAHQKLFAAWIGKSVRGHFDDWVGVAELRGRLAGFISCSKTGRSTGTIGLVGVARKFQRQGIGRGLLSQAFDWFRGRAISHVSVVTQGRAIAAQRFYQDYGFRTRAVEFWYHRWF